MAEGNNSRPRFKRAPESVIRSERFARLVTLAGLLIGAARASRRVVGEDRARRAERRREELRETSTLNVVNFEAHLRAVRADRR
jgi:proteasome accessory factor C